MSPSSEMGSTTQTKSVVIRRARGHCMVGVQHRGGENVDWYVHLGQVNAPVVDGTGDRSLHGRPPASIQISRPRHIASPYNHDKPNPAAL